MLAFVLATLLVQPLELAHRPAVRELFAALLADARYGHSKVEEAAFIVANADGSLSFVRWPRTRTSREARWPARFPPNVVAIVHTHPNTCPDPSPTDLRTARRREVPVYVITRHRITKTTGGGATVVASGEWHRHLVSSGYGLIAPPAKR